MVALDECTNRGEIMLTEMKVMEDFVSTEGSQFSGDGVDLCSGVVLVLSSYLQVSLKKCGGGAGHNEFRLYSRCGYIPRKLH